jgi:hypothetical protein
MNRTRSFALHAGAVALVASLPAADASACASCGCGDPTLTAMGVEQPFQGRLRSAVELSYRTDRIGTPGVDELSLRELRADATLAWAPLDTLFLVASVPFVYREARDPSLAESDAWGLGDIELRAKWFAYRDRALAPRWLLALVGGVKFPTAPWQTDPDGNRAPLEAQPGTGSLDLLLGPTLALFQGRVSAYLGAQWFQPVLTRDPLEPGSSVRGFLALQHQTWSWLALRAAADGRWDEPAREDGQVDPNSGGWVLFAGADLLWSPLEDTSLSLGFRVPVVEELHGDHDEGPRVALALVRDW